MFKHLLVPTDGSPLSGETVERAIAFAKGAGARITFFCAVQSFPTMYHGIGAIFDAQAPARYHEAVDGVAQDILDAAVKLATAAGVDCAKLTLASAEPYAAIIEAAERQACDLIFMASHGRKGINALLLGSETNKVLTHSKIPVLVYR
ncbi:MAG: sulfate transporter [Candidatus Accumulibacter sp. 66-26]|nr:universal stress protein [Accumulibacter sp.]OJW49977.1 MAG: sulfate transporter [Candidatus Accumulibacter sp. 66-26]